jgi:hypothetical protein
MTTKTTMTRTIRLAIGTAAVMALMSQAAQARPISQQGGSAQDSSSTLVQKGTYMPVSPANNVAAAHPNHNPTVLVVPPARGQVTQLTPPTQTVTGKTSVDWFAAAVGTGLAFALVLVVIGASALIEHGRRRDPLSA